MLRCDSLSMDSGLGNRRLARLPILITLVSCKVSHAMLYLHKITHCLGHDNGSLGVELCVGRHEKLGAIVSTNKLSNGLLQLGRMYIITPSTDELVRCSHSHYLAIVFSDE